MSPPWQCWDAGGKHEVSRDRMFTAMRGAACGTVLVVQGVAGLVTVTVVDHGPNCVPACPERGLDLSVDAFRAVVGPLSVGIALVSYRVL